MNFASENWKEILAAWYSKLDSKISLKIKNDLLSVLKKYGDIKIALEDLPNDILRSILSKGKWYDEGKRYLEYLHNKKVSHTIIYSENYPKNFYYLPDPPIFLSYLGSPIWNDILKLSIVGSRNPSTRSLKWMEDNLLELFENKICSVSGAAIGIDQKTHNLSLRLKKPTIGILPSGIGNIYPNSFSPMVDDILACGGAVLSEFSFDAVMQKFYFHNRNRLIAALGDATLIVEARIRSGTMITANKAIEIGKPLAVLPAFPTDSKSCGNVKLLMDGVLPIRDAKDLLILISSQASQTI